MGSANPNDYGWDWRKFVGPADDLKWARVDLGNLDVALSRKELGGHRIAVQAGSNLGIFPKRLAQVFDHVYTFEPEPKLFAAMLKNAPESNIYRFQAAVGCKPDFVTLKNTRRDGSAAPQLGVTHVIEKSGPVPTLKLDDFGFPACDLLYLDVEGWEPYAIVGANQTIKQHRPVIVVEINKALDHVGVHPDTLRGLILDHRYEMVARIRSDEIYVPKERS